MFIRFTATQRNDITIFSIVSQKYSLPNLTTNPISVDTEKKINRQRLKDLYGDTIE
jgi:hypothetical protein